MNERSASMNPADLRGILNYVPRFLGQTFIVSLDGAILQSKNLPNILLDIAVLRSLQINVVIVHGISRQLAALADERGLALSNADGFGPTDPQTLDLAIRASSRASHQILEALTQTGLKCAITNSVRAAPLGILKGQDQKLTGKVDRIDADVLQHLIAKEIIPIIQPIGFDRNGSTLRINSDLLAIETAFALKATKVLFLSPLAGLSLGGALQRQLPLHALETQLAQPDATPQDSRSKAEHALLGVKGGISRIHILDGALHDGLIQEVFSNEGVGTLVYGNEYQQIRPARRADVPHIFHLASGSVEKEALARRSIESIERDIQNFHVYEIDGHLIGCVLITEFAEEPDTVELNALVVHPLHQKQGIGLKLVNFACHKAQQDRRKRMLALSTQSFGFFQTVCGFRETGPDTLPASRREAYAQQQRQSKILLKEL